MGLSVKQTLDISGSAKKIKLLSNSPTVKIVSVCVGPSLLKEQKLISPFFFPLWLITICPFLSPSIWGNEGDLQILIKALHTTVCAGINNIRSQAVKEMVAKSPQISDFRSFWALWPDALCFSVGARRWLALCPKWRCRKKCYPSRVMDTDLGHLGATGLREEAHNWAKPKICKASVDGI